MAFNIMPDDDYIKICNATREKKHLLPTDIKIKDSDIQTLLTLNENAILEQSKLLENEKLKFQKRLNNIENIYKNASTIDGIINLDAVHRMTIIFKDNKNIVGIIGKEIYIICGTAFQNCINLSTVDLPKIYEIGPTAFQGCGIKSLTLPQIQYIDDEAFLDCKKLTTINFQNYKGYFKKHDSDEPSRGSHQQNIFKNCINLTDIDIPNLTIIPFGMFEGCSSLAKTPFPQVTMICRNGFKNCSALTNLDFPKLIYDYGGFNSCQGLTKVTLPKIQEMHDTFSDCSNLTEINAPEAIRIDGAFYNCSALKNYYLPKITTVGNKAFAGCSSIDSISFPLPLTNIGEDAFKGCSSLTSIDLPQVTHISMGSFQNCTSVASISLPALQDNEISPRVFQGCSALKTLILPVDQITSIKSISLQGHCYGAFANCSALEEINFPNVLQIGGSTFSECSSLKTVNLPSLTKLPNDYSSSSGYEFANCSSLQKINFPNLTEVGYKSFIGCHSLQYFIAPKLQAIDSSSFQDCPNLIFNIQDYPELKSIGWDALSGNTTITNLDCSQNNHIEISTSLGYLPNLVELNVDLNNELDLSNKINDYRTPKLQKVIFNCPIKTFSCWYDVYYDSWDGRDFPIEMKIVVNSTEPIISNNVQDAGNVNYYVPQSMLSEYQKTWSFLKKSKILPITDQM